MFADVDAATGWCDKERAALLEAAQLAFEHQAFDIAWRLPVFAGGPFRQCGWYAESLAMIDVGLAAARAVGESGAEASLLNGRSSLMTLAGRFEESAQDLTAALRIRREIGDRIGEVAVLSNLGSLLSHQGRWAESMTHQLQALAMSRALGRRSAEANSLNNLGTCANALGQDAEALDYLHAALEIHREEGDVDGEAVALLNLAEVHLHHGRPAESLPSSNRHSPSPGGLATVTRRPASSPTSAGSRQPTRPRPRLAPFSWRPTPCGRNWAITTPR
ncbi:tetratricopeptide repeat protein [Streptacidiphilus monticola]